MAMINITCYAQVQFALVYLIQLRKGEQVLSLWTVFSGKNNNKRIKPQVLRFTKFPTSKRFARIFRQITHISEICTSWSRRSMTGRLFSRPQHSDNTSRAGQLCSQSHISRGQFHIYRKLNGFSSSISLWQN